MVILTEVCFQVRGLSPYQSIWMTEMDRTCPTCHGKKRILVIDNPNRKWYQSLKNHFEVCQTCHGTGRIVPYGDKVISPDEFNEMIAPKRTPSKPPLCPNCKRPMQLRQIRGSTTTINGRPMRLGAQFVWWCDNCKKGITI